MSYHLRGFKDLPDKTPPDTSDVVRATVGLPGFNVDVPIVSKERLYLAIGAAVLVGVAGGSVLAAYLKRAQS